MIKINLATRKQSTLVADSGRGGAPFTGKMPMPDLKDLPIRKLVVYAVAFGLLNFMWDSIQKQELEKTQQDVVKLHADQARINSEISKTKIDDIKLKQTEADAATLKIKLETINKLMSDRQSPPKILLTLATGIPKNVWLTDIKLGADAISLKGNAGALDDVSDFIKTLNESTFFAEMKLVNSQQTLDDQQNEIASFEMVAKRK